LHHALQSSDILLPSGNFLFIMWRSKHVRVQTNR